VEIEMVDTGNTRKDVGAQEELLVLSLPRVRNCDQEKESEKAEAE
jgi:hypothetical protein